MRGDHLILIAAALLGLYVGRRLRRSGPQAPVYGGPLLAGGTYFRGVQVITTPSSAATWGLGVPNIAGGG